MRMQIKKNLFLFFFLCFYISSIFSQNEISSPYSGYGIGKINHNNSIVLQSMGGVSLAMQNPYIINFRNPASYIAFDSLSFIADASFSLISSSLKTKDSHQKNMVARPNYLVIGLPVTKHWRTSAGILPFSDIGFKILDSKTNQSSVKNYRYEGEGGLLQLYWGNAFKLYKGLSIGLNASYLFGQLTSVRTAEFDEENFFNTSINHSVKADGIYLSGGVQYLVNMKEKHTLGIGIVYENTAYIWARENELITIFQGSYDKITSIDTLSNRKGIRGNMVVPQSIGGGFSYAYNQQLLIGGDITWKNWENYTLMNKTESELRNSWLLNFGAQYTPDPFSPQYFKRINFRAGVKYETGYIIINNNSIDEIVFSFGLGFPLRGTSSNSSLNVMFEYGQWGTLKKHPISEDYYKLSFSFILQEKWYQRVKLD